MEVKDYYQILNVSRDADDKAIKQAYRKLARKYHPDVSTETDAEERFKELQEAYEVLKDDKKRAAYNQYGEHWKAGMEFGEQPGPGHGGFYREKVRPEDLSDMDDILASIFGDMAGKGRRRAAWRGQDEYADITITLKEAFQGTTKNLGLSGWELDNKGHPQNQSRTIKVKIPPGVVDGQRIRLAGQGQKGSDPASNGDLYLNVSIRPDRGYRLRKRDIYLDVPITPWEAALGDVITIQTMGGKINLTIPAGSQTGQELRLRGKGLPGKPAGDLFAVIKIVVPEAKTEQDRQLFAEMKKTMNFNPRTDRVK